MVVRNNVALCCVEILHAFGRAFMVHHQFLGTKIQRNLRKLIRRNNQGVRVWLLYRTEVHIGVLRFQKKVLS